jgi:hypothetical protein
MYAYNNSTCTIQIHLVILVCNCILINECLFVYHFSPYSTIFQLHDGGQFRKPRYIIQCIWEETTNLPQLSHTVTSVRVEFEPTRAGGERYRGVRLMS